MNKEFHKDVSKMGWDEVRRRQLHRLPLVYEWMELTCMKEGSRVLDIGCGPGVFVMEYAKVVGPTGHVYVVEQSAEAIARMEEETKAFNMVTHYCLNAEDSLPVITDIDIVMLTDVLHHTNEPSRILNQIYGRASGTTKMLVSEFDPEARGEIGPPLQNRLPSVQVRRDLKAIGFKVLLEGKQNFEHYYFLVGI